MKKFLSVALALVFALSVFAVCASAEAELPTEDEIKQAQEIIDGINNIVPGKVFIRFSKDSGVAGQEAVGVISAALGALYPSDDVSGMTEPMKFNDREFKLTVPENDMAKVYAVFKKVAGVDFVGFDQKIALKEYLLGDVNGDKIIDTADYILVKRHVASGYKFSVPDWCGDVNNDETVDVADYILIKRHIVGSYTIPYVTAV